MSTRTMNHWNVTLQRADGEIVEYKFSAYWDPEQQETTEAVKTAAAAQAWWESNKTPHAPISAALLVDEAPEALAA